LCVAKHCNCLYRIPLKWFFLPDHVTEHESNYPQFSLQDLHLDYCGGPSFVFVCAHHCSCHSAIFKVRQIFPPYPDPLSNYSCLLCYLVLLYSLYCYSIMQYNSHNWCFIEPGRPAQVSAPYLVVGSAVRTDLACQFKSSSRSLKLLTCPGSNQS